MKLQQHVDPNMEANRIATTLLRRPEVRKVFEDAAASITSGEVPAAAAEFGRLLVEVRDRTTLTIGIPDVEARPAAG